MTEHHATELKFCINLLGRYTERWSKYACYFDRSHHSKNSISNTTSPCSNSVRELSTRVSSGTPSLPSAARQLSRTRALTLWWVRMETRVIYLDFESFCAHFILFLWWPTSLTPGYEDFNFISFLLRSLYLDVFFPRLLSHALDHSGGVLYRSVRRARSWGRREQCSASERRFALPFEPWCPRCLYFWSTDQALCRRIGASHVLQQQLVLFWLHGKFILGDE